MRNVLFRLPIRYKLYHQVIEEEVVLVGRGAIGIGWFCLEDDSPGHVTQRSVLGLTRDEHGLGLVGL